MYIYLFIHSLTYIVERHAKKKEEIMFFFFCFFVSCFVVLDIARFGQVLNYPKHNDIY